MTVLVTCTDERVRAGSKRWRAVRQSGIGASEIAGALGISPYTSPLSLYLEKRGELADDRDNASMEWGRNLEATILKRFLKCHPEFRDGGPVLTGRLYRSKERPWQLATPDAVVFDRRIGFASDKGPRRTREGMPVVVEIKTAGSRDGWGEERSDEIPVHYRAQVMQTMDVVGARVAWVPVLINGRDYREYRVERHERDLHILRTRGAEFWARVQRGDPPPPDGHAATTRALKGTAFDPGGRAQVPPDLIHKIERAKRLQKRIENLRERLENELRAEMGEAGVALAGSAVVARRTTYTQRSTDLTALREAHPEIAAAYTKPEVRHRLNVTSKELS